MATQVVQLEDSPNDAMLDALLADLDLVSAGDIQILNDQAEILVTIPLNFPNAFGDAAPDAGPPTGSRAAWAGANQEGTATTQTNQIATAFNVRDQAAGSPSVIFDGSVGVNGAGEAMEFSNTTMNNGDTIRITAAGSSMFMPDNF